MEKYLKALENPTRSSLCSTPFCFYVNRVLGHSKAFYAWDNRHSVVSQLNICYVWVSWKELLFFLNNISDKLSTVVHLTQKHLPFIQNGHYNNSLVLFHNLNEESCAEKQASTNKKIHFGYLHGFLNNKRTWFRHQCRRLQSQHLESEIPIVTYRGIVPMIPEMNCWCN